MLTESRVQNAHVQGKHMATLQMISLGVFEEAEDGLIGELLCREGNVIDVNLL
jgi:hypothetical protein